MQKQQQQNISVRWTGNIQRFLSSLLDSKQSVPEIPQNFRPTGCAYIYLVSISPLLLLLFATSKKVVITQSLYGDKRKLNMNFQCSKFESQMEREANEQGSRIVRAIFFLKKSSKVHSIFAVCLIACMVQQSTGAWQVDAHHCAW